MTNYFKWQMTVPDDQLLEDFWENSRGGDNIISIYWLYSHTGDAFLLELAEKIHATLRTGLSRPLCPTGTT
mgnify:FL=1